MAEFKPKVWMTCPLCNKQSPMPDPDYREWQGLTETEVDKASTHFTEADGFRHGAYWAEEQLKEKNHDH